MKTTKRADREVVVADHGRADEEDGRLGEHRHERDQRHVERPLAIRLHGLAEHCLRAVPELRLLGRLLREGLDDVDADDALLRDGGDVGELLLHVAEGRVREVAVPVGEHDQERHDRERDQCELPLDEEEYDRHGDDDEYVLEEEDQAVAEEEPDPLEVDRRPGHELAGLVGVVEAERQPNEPGVERVAHVELHSQGLAPGDQPPPDHQRGLEHAEADDRPDVDVQLVPVVRHDRLVDHAADHPDERDLRSLRTAGQHDRDDQRDLVRLQEAEQPRERSAIENRLRHYSSLAAAPAPLSRPRRA